MKGFGISSIPFDNGKGKGGELSFRKGVGVREEANWFLEGNNIKDRGAGGLCCL